MILEVDIRLRQGDFVLDAQFRTPAGMTALFGPSGGGKSTVLAVLAGLRRARGSILMYGRPMQRLKAHQRGFGMVFQDTRLFPHLSVRGNIAFAAARAPRKTSASVDDLASFFQITELMDRPVTNLSGGEKGRVALARAIAAGPDMLLLDEPFAALDSVRRQAFIGILISIHREFGLPMLIVTHVIDDAIALAEHIVAVRAGKVIAYGAISHATRSSAFRSLLDTRDVGVALPSSVLMRGSSRQGVTSVWLRADHVLLAAARPEAISARNVMEGRIVDLAQEDGGSRLVTLETDAGTILSRLTMQAVSELGFRVGGRAWALVKAHAL